jgi:hypothetical protein
VSITNIKLDYRLSVVDVSSRHNKLDVQKNKMILIYHMPRAGCVWWLHLGEKGNRCDVL